MDPLAELFRTEHDHPQDTIVLCGFVLGHRGDPSQLEEKLQAREQPSDRKTVDEFAFKGGKLPS